MKRIIASVVVLWCLMLPVSALEIPKATNEFFVNDYADVLSESEERTLQQRAENLYQACGAQVVVVTLETLEGEALADVSLRIARQWGIGDKEKDNGLLLIFAESEERVRIEVGSGLEGAIPDSKAGRILDHEMLPTYPVYAAGILATQETLVGEVYMEYGLTPDETYTPVEERYPEEEDDGLFSTIIKVIVGIIVVIVLIRNPRLLLYFLFFGGRGGRGGGGFSSGGGSSGGFSGGGFSGGGGGFSGGGAER